MTTFGKPAAEEKGPVGNRVPQGARRTLLEILAMLSLAVVPSLIYSAIDFYFPDKGPPAGPLTILLDEGLALFRVSMPILFIMWATGKGMRHFGFKRLEPWDVLYAIGIMLGAFTFHVIVWIVLTALAPDLVHSLSLSHEDKILRTFAEMHGTNAVLLLIPGCFLIGFGEELVFRGYLLTRLTDLTGSKGQALFLTTILFGFMHIYQGAMGIVSTAAFAAFYGAVFLTTRRFWPLAIAHALTDFISFVGG